MHEQYDIPVRRIGVEGGDASFVDEQITGKLYPLDRAMPSSSTPSEVYQRACETLGAELNDLYAAGTRHIMGVCCGYTSYGLFALKRAVQEINDAHPDDPFSGNIIIQDSSFPDTDTFNTDLDEQGYPTSRFYGPAYQSLPHLRIAFTLNGAVPFDVSLSKRAPRECVNLMTTFPFTPRYMRRWQDERRRTQSEARKLLDGVLPQWDKIQPDDRIVPLLASGGCWEESSVGKWMTAEQYDTVLQGTNTLVQALVQVAQEHAQQIVLPIIRQGGQYILSASLQGVYPIEQRQSASEPGLFVLPYDTVPQPLFANLILSSDLVVNRAVQANSFAETILAHVSQVVLTIPGAGYMDAELMAQSLERGHLRHNQSVAQINEELTRLLTDHTYRDQRVNSLWAIFQNMFTSTESNFGHVLMRAAGLTT
jgi:hypothetical protein